MDLQPCHTNQYYSGNGSPIGFNSHGIDYEIDEYGVIHQLNPQPYTYDANYVSTYDTEAYRRQSDILQALRLGFVIAAHGIAPYTLADFGYGNGAFLKFIEPQVAQRYGIDVTGLPVDGCDIIQLNNNQWKLIPDAEVYTFWDALEHVGDITFVRDLSCGTIVISLPFCHYRNLGKDWFDNQYKHRKPNEHLHHFDRYSLHRFMQAMGWRLVASSTHEDIVRKSPGDWPNILTMAFKR